VRLFSFAHFKGGGYHVQAEEIHPTAFRAANSVYDKAATDDGVVFL